MKNYLLFKSTFRLPKGIFALVALCVLISTPILAQVQVSGVVYSELAEPLPGVTVIETGTTNGVVTDIEGRYSFTLKDEASSISFSFIGYKTAVEVVNGRSVIDQNLVPDLKELEEVVVIGYGTQKKSHLTGAISKVTNESLDQIPLSRVDDALVGQVSGVQIQMTDPEVGAAPTIRVRGVGSISGSASPAIVVDGIVVDADYMGSMDMNDVESIEVLKDAASGAIYGSRGGNGVIMITTKSGKVGPTKFSYNGYFGHKWVQRQNIRSTVDEWEDYVRANNGEWVDGDNGPEFIRNGETTDKVMYAQQIVEATGETDWEEVLMPGGNIQSHSISASGGNERTTFRISGSYLNDEGVLVEDNYEKFNLKVNMNTKVNEYFEFGINLNPQISKQDRFGTAMQDVLRQSSFLPIYVTEDNIKFVNPAYVPIYWDEETDGVYQVQIGDYFTEDMFDISKGTYIDENGAEQTGDWGYSVLKEGFFHEGEGFYEYDANGDSTFVEYDATEISTTGNTNAYAKATERTVTKDQTKVVYSTYVTIKPVEWLSFTSTLAGDFKLTESNRYNGIYHHRNGPGEASSEFVTQIANHFGSTNMFSYNDGFGKHNVGVVAGFAYEQWNVYESSMEATGFENDNVQTISVGQTVTQATTYEEQRALVSYISRVNYDYDGKYLLSASFRRDGSSKFGNNYKYGNFPAVSIGWRVSEEGFLQGNSIISDLKLRASWGVTGTDAIDDWYGYISRVESISATLNNTAVSGSAIANIADDNLRWEKQKEINPGIDLGILDNRIRFSADYYRRESSDLLLEVPIPSTTGFTYALQNRGAVRNEGVELELSMDLVNNDLLSWTISGNGSYNKNTLTDYAGSDGLVLTSDKSDSRTYQWIAQEGESISSFYGYVYDREIPSEYTDNLGLKRQDQGSEVHVKDLNGDGLINEEDKTILGSPFPDFVWSVTNTFMIKGFDISFMFNGSHGAEVRNADPQSYFNEFSGVVVDDVNAINYYEDHALLQNRVLTSDIVMDASYIALRNINIGYTFSKELTSKIGLTKARVYVAGQNLIYLMSDDYLGYNPEGVNQTEFNAPMMYGAQRGAYPLSKTVTAGINLQF